MYGTSTIIAPSRQAIVVTIMAWTKLMFASAVASSCVPPLQPALADVPGLLLDVFSIVLT
ncbi:unnamed protein product [Protopolystoma xenopodis]|uniref:Uncharacterized protein n=1 Tax=Protopolystoma xenopodis TaxID=117903 RepID=A0A3S5AXF2_9PLAT|nr:unnamed protein product [Protopolystoma xenopodis]